MALSAAIVWEVRPSGSDTNGGGFKAGASGTDWTQQDTAQYSVTDAVTAGTTTITSATANFGTDVVGNVLYIQGGTGAITAGWYEITARSSASNITVDRSTGLTAGTGATLKIGGGFASPGQAGKVHVGQNTIYVLNVGNDGASVYTLTTKTANVSGGSLALAAGTSGSSRTNLVGYTAGSRTLYNRSNRPLIKNGAFTSFRMIDVGVGDFTGISNIRLDGNSQTSVSGIDDSSSSYRQRIVRVVVGNVTGVGIGLSSGYTDNMVIDCHVFGGANIGIASTHAIGCSVTSCGGTAGLSIFESAHSCIAYNNTTGGLVALIAVGCVAYGNASYGIAPQNSPHNYAVNCIAYGNGTYGYQYDSAGTDSDLMRTCAAGSNTSGNTKGAPNGDRGAIGDAVIVLTADPFVDAANGNFALNTTAGGGALCRAAGFPGVFPSGLTTGYLDIGAAQAAGGGLKLAGRSGLAG